MEQPVDEEQHDAAFTPNQIRMLQVFADNLIMGGHAFRLLAWFCGFVAAMTAFLYYFAGILQDWHGPGGSK